MADVLLPAALAGPAKKKLGIQQKKKAMKSKSETYKIYSELLVLPSWRSSQRRFIASRIVARHRAQQRAWPTSSRPLCRCRHPRARTDEICVRLCRSLQGAEAGPPGKPPSLTTPAEMLSCSQVGLSLTKGCHEHLFLFTMSIVSTQNLA